LGVGWHDILPDDIQSLPAKIDQGVSQLTGCGERE
ncbi:unnamed protein product, partial [marine sediment metagenome]